MTPETRAAIRTGLRDALLIELAYIPFDLAAGAVMAQTNVAPALSILSSPVLFAGAAQLVAIRLLDSGAGIALIVFSVLVINARHLLYSASLQPHLAGWTRAQRLGAAFLLSDPVYALAISRFEREGGAGRRAAQLGYYFSAGITLYLGWAVLLGAGVVLGAFLPTTIPIELAIPLTFLLLLLPLLKDRDGLVAAAVGGVAALAASALPFGFGLLVGAVAGLAAGALVQARTDRVEEASDG